MSDTTKLTELVTGLGMLGGDHPLAMLPVLPGEFRTVDDVTVELLRTYRAAGVNRVSLGVQSMSAHVLVSLGRTHDQRNVERAVDAIQQSEMPSFNLDLIYGAAGESVDDWRRTVEAALAFDPPHISAYGLTVEAGTPLATQPDRHPDDDDQADHSRTAAAYGPGAEGDQVSGVARGVGPAVGMDAGRDVSRGGHGRPHR